MPEWSITRLRGKWALTWRETVNGKQVRRRYSLDTSDRKEAEARAPSWYAQLTRSNSPVVADLWQEYLEDNEHKAVVKTMKFTWKAIAPRFGNLQSQSITVPDCKAHISERQSNGISDATIRTELAHLSMVLKWAEKNSRVEKAPYILKPAQVPARDVVITRDEAAKLMKLDMPSHIRLAIYLMIGTGARIGALLELTWDRIDFDGGKIHLANPFDRTRRKGRAVAAMNNQCRQELIKAKERAITPFVIEYRGKGVKRIDTALSNLGKQIGRDDITPHVFRHSAAVWLIEAGRPITEIAQFLGHKSTATTFEVYARYSTEHLSGTASELEI